MVLIRVVSYADELPAIHSIRQQVFQVEQGVDAALEFDGLDEAATHLLAYPTPPIETAPIATPLPIATARIRTLSKQLAKIERVAVLAEYRGWGIGKAMMIAAIDHIAQQGIPEIKINAQTQVQGFYQKLGFEPQGDVFDEAGIPHIDMRKQVTQSPVDRV
jgi:predicted GNAT family N-acyltransferase